MKRRLLSGLLALAMVLSLVPFGALAEGTEETETTAVTEATEAAKVTEETKAAEAAETTEAAEVTETTEATEVTKPVESEPTAVEQVQALIDALPENVTAENRAAVEVRLTAIDDAKLSLTDEEWEGLDFGKYNAAIAAINELDGMAGAEVPKTLYDLQYITAVGNGEDNWLNGESWNVNAESNKMTEVSTGVWEITYNDIDAYDNYQVKFACNGSWQTYNWTSDGVLDGQDNPSNVVGEDGSSVTLRIDVNGFDFATGTGSVTTAFIVTAPGAAPTVGYTITFNPNGGTLPDGVASTATTDTDGKLTTLPTPTKSGNAFLGWYNGETKWDTSMTVSENMTLTAKWSDGSNVTSGAELEACLDAGFTNIKLGDDIPLDGTLIIPEGKDITLDMNGHRLTVITKGSIAVQVKGKLTLTGDGTIACTGAYGTAVHVDGGTFVMQNGTVQIDGDTSVCAYVESGTFTMLDGNMIFSDAGVEIEADGTFNMNGGIIRPGSGCEGKSVWNLGIMNANGGTVNGVVNNAGSITTTSGTGTVFTGTEAENENGTVSGGDFSNVNTLKGIYKVTFQDGNNTVATQYRANAPADELAYTKENFVLLGWYNGDTEWDFTQKVTEDLTLTAKFQSTDVTTEDELKNAIEKGATDIQLKSDITLSYDLLVTQQDWNLDLKGHTLSGAQIKFSTGAMTVNDSVGGGSVNNTVTLTSATLTGTVFNGYVNCLMSTIDGGTFNGQVNLLLGSDVKNGMFYAQSSFGTATTTGKQVVFQLNGSFLHMQVTTGTVAEPDVAKTGYTFTGWCQDADCKGDKWDFTKTVSENMTLYGKSEIITYTITYAPGAEDANGTIASGTKTYGQDFILTPSVYTREGYVQKGWEDEDGNLYQGGDTYKENADLNLTAVWEEVNSFTVPFTKTVKQSGSTKPGKATFSLYICGIEKLPSASGNIDCTGRVDIKGTGDFAGELTISGSRELVWAMLENGIYIREWDSEMDNWTYDDSVYFLRLNQYDDGYRLDVYDATAKTVDQTVVFSHGSKTVKMTFTNTYGTTTTTADSSNPKTGDSIWLAVGTLILSTMALVAILPRKKRM